MPHAQGSYIIQSGLYLLASSVIFLTEYIPIISADMILISDLEKAISQDNNLTRLISLHILSCSIFSSSCKVDLNFLLQVTENKKHSM